MTVQHFLYLYQIVVCSESCSPWRWLLITNEKHTFPSHIQQIVRSMANKNILAQGLNCKVTTVIVSLRHWLHTRPWGRHYWGRSLGDGDGASKTEWEPFRSLGFWMDSPGRCPHRCGGGTLWAGFQMLKSSSQTGCHSDLWNVVALNPEKMAGK